METYTRENNPYEDRDNAELQLKAAHRKVTNMRARVLKFLESGKVVPDSLARQHRALEQAYDRANDDFMSALARAIAFAQTDAGHDMAYGAREVYLPSGWFDNPA